MTSLSKANLFSDLGYEPHEGQWLVHRSRAKRRVVACGARWGKTYCAAMEALAAALEPRERSLGWVCAPTYDLASRVFRRMQLVVLEDLSHRVIEMHERERRFSIRNMSGGVSEVRTKSADRPVTLLGETLDWLVLDECARISQDVWESYLSPRLLDRDGWALLISTPRGPGWFHRMFRSGQRGRTPGIESWNGPTAQNPHVPLEVVEAERGRLTPEIFSQEYLAVFLGVEQEPCEACGFPALDAPGVLIVRTPDELRTCLECKNPVDVTGRTATKKVPGGVPRLLVIRLTQHLGPDPDLPPSVQAIVRAKDEAVQRDPWGIDSSLDDEDEDEEAGVVEDEEVAKLEAAREMADDEDEEGEDEDDPSPPNDLAWRFVRGLGGRG